MTSMSMKPQRFANTRIIQNFHLVWLDESIDENNDDYRNSIRELRQVVNTVNTFIDADECINFITNIKETAFMVISRQQSQRIIPVVEDIPQVTCIYIFGENNLPYESWAKKCIKVKGVFTDIISICDALRQVVKVCDRNSISISFINTSDGSSNQNLDQLDPSFMYTQILKDILLTIDFQQVHFDEFLRYCREQFIGNDTQLNTVKKIQKEYRSDQSIWWYTYPCFLYSMVNKALRSMDAPLIVNMGFFVRDLHNNIVSLHGEQNSGKSHYDLFTVYRGQGLTPTVFDQMKKTQGGLMAFNNFLSTSLDKQISLTFAESNTYNPNLIGVLFEIKIDSSISSFSFANVKNVSYYNEEEEILFSMHSVFRIGQVKQIQNNVRLWQVDLTLTDDNDPELHNLTEIMRNDIRGFTGWHRLGHLMIKVAQFDKAEELYEILLKQTTTDVEKLHLFGMLGSIKHDQGKYADAAEFYEKSIKIKQKILPPIHSDLATSYNNIGLLYDNMGEYPKALSYYEKALEIRQETLPANHPDFATSYNNIGGMYRNMGEYSKALSYYEKALEILQKTLPANHPDLATSYNNIGAAYIKMSKYSKTLLYFEKAREIFEKTLPANHPDLATSYNNIGLVYHYMSEYSKAHLYYEKALEIEQKALPANHPSLATSYNNIGGVYKDMGEYSEALSYYEKALQIRQKTLSANHPAFAESYNNIGWVYYHMGEYLKALSHHEKALEIQQNTLPENHPALAASYNNIGEVYIKMNEYSKTLSYYEKSIKIKQKTLPANHPDLATSYDNIGWVYYHMGEYLKALSHHEKALEIRQNTLPENHPDLATSYNNTGWVYRNMGDYKKALLYYERALDIKQRSLPPNHPSIKYVKEGIEIVKKKL